MPTPITRTSPSSLLSKSSKSMSGRIERGRTRSLSEPTLPKNSESRLSLGKNSQELLSGSNTTKTMLTSKSGSETRSKSCGDVETLLLGKPSETMKPENLLNCPSTGPTVGNHVPEQRAQSLMEEVSLRVNSEPTLIARERSKSELIRKMTIGEQFTTANAGSNGLPLEMRVRAPMQVGKVSANTNSSADRPSASSSHSQTTIYSRSATQSDRTWDTVVSDDVQGACKQTTPPATRKSRIAWAGARETGELAKHSYIRVRPTKARRLHSPPPTEISWSADTCESVFEDNFDEEDALDSFDSWFHPNPTRPLWPPISAKSQPTTTIAKTDGTVVPAQTRYELKHQKLRQAERKDKSKPKDPPLFLEGPDAMPSYFSNYFHQPVKFWAEPQEPSEVTTEQIYPLSHTNTNNHVRSPLRSHPEWQHNRAYRNTPADSKWHTTCPFDNTRHSHENPIELDGG